MLGATLAGTQRMLHLWAAGESLPSMLLLGCMRRQAYGVFKQKLQ